MSELHHKFVSIIYFVTSTLKDYKTKRRNCINLEKFKDQLRHSFVTGCHENLTIENSDLRPRKTDPPIASVEKNSDPLGVSETQAMAFYLLATKKWHKRR